MEHIVYKHFETIDSTNTWGKQNCHLFDKKIITLITADSQTAGRGRFKREWISPPKENIYATFCFPFDQKRLDIGNIPQVIALSISDVLKQLNFQPQLKWPNDILLSEKKVGGILCETVSFPDHLMIILGVGLNINMKREMLDLIDRPATSLQNETGQEYEVKMILKLIEQKFIQDLILFKQQGFKPFLNSYKELLWTNSHREISFHQHQNTIVGIIHSINDDGSLNLQLKNGSIKAFISGELI